MKNRVLLKCALNAGCKSVRDFAKFIKENSRNYKHIKNADQQKQQQKNF